MYKVLVLGATGLIGGHIAKKAQDIGWQVHGFRRNKNSTGHLQEQDIQWFLGRLEDYDSLLAAMRGMDMVFHAAGFTPPDQNPASVPLHVKNAEDQMQRVIQAAREAQIKRLIYTSSLTTIGPPPSGSDRLADERDHYQLGSMPGNGYYECKSIMEKIALEAESRNGLDVVVLNPTLVLGPGDTHLSTGEILLMVAKGRVKAVPSGTLNIIDARDTAEAHINAARIGKRGERYILGGLNYSIQEAVTVMAKIADVKPPSYTLKPWMIDAYLKIAGFLPVIPHPHSHIRAYKKWQGYNTTKARQELQLQTRMLEETIRDSIKWFTNQGVG
jgi:dihydroflavonol-4-reductase